MNLESIFRYVRHSPPRELNWWPRWTELVTPVVGSTSVETSSWKHSNCRGQTHAVKNSLWKKKMLMNIVMWVLLEGGMFVSPVSRENPSVVYLLMPITQWGVRINEWWWPWEPHVSRYRKIALRDWWSMILVDTASQGGCLYYLPI